MSTAFAGYVACSIQSARCAFIDIGWSGGIDPVLRLFGDRLGALAFDARVEECERLAKTEIRGFPKDSTVLCLDADSIALHAAVAHGTGEVCWLGECQVFKVMHSNTHVQLTATVWKDWQRQLDNYLLMTKRRQLATKLRIWVDYPRRQARGLEEGRAPSIERHFVAKAIRFARSDISVTTNDTRWGLASEVLPERIHMRGGWDGS